MQEYVSAPERRYPSPSAQRRSGEHWKARVGLGFVIVLTLCSAAIMFRLAGMGVGSASSALRAPTAAAGVPTVRPNTAAPAGTAPAGAVPAGTTPAPAAQPAGSTPAPGAQPAATPAAQPSPTAQAQATAQPSPTTRPGQREHTVASGDNLSAIATRYNTTVAAIVAANNLPSSGVTLSIGQRLVIPG